MHRLPVGATFPGRVVVAAVQQNRPGDVGCGDPPKPCSEEPSQPLCARAKQVKVYAMDANEVTGNVLISLLLRSESCCVQSWIHAKPNTSAIFASTNSLEEWTSFLFVC